MRRVNSIDIELDAVALAAVAGGQDTTQVVLVADR